MARRILFFAYGVVSYAIFFGTYLYALGFVTGIGTPTSLDSGEPAPIGPALAINLGLLGLFAVQHSVMARPAFKRWWTRFVPEPIERSTYVLASSVCMILLYAFWQPTGPVLWDLAGTAPGAVLTAFSITGFLIVLVTTFLINHFDLFGLRQVWLHLLGKEVRPVGFREPAPYRFVRHPLYVGWLLAFWAAPVMSVAHLAFAGACTGYILVAIVLEERDLLAVHPEYEAYRRRVPALVPRIRRAPSVAERGLATR